MQKTVNDTKKGDPMKGKLILASGSPRRIEMFQKHEIPVQICPSKLEERLPDGLTPEQTVMYLSLGKALDVERRLSEEQSNSGQDVYILGADTVVVLDRILGKPMDREDAFSMLRSLRNRAHRVLTGVTILKAGTTERISFYETTTVRTKMYTDEDILAYIETGEPMDKAGAYAIQGGFAKFIEGYDGDYENVIGLPWKRVKEKLDEMGVFQ